jgi:4-hydroxy-tetrahydrodipicolinate synthase
VFAGSENFLLATLRAGGAGCITATGNVNPSAIVRLYDTWRDPDAEQRQAKLAATRAVFAKYPMISAMKAAIAWKTGRDDWAAVRPPLVELGADQRRELEVGLRGVGFELPDASALA